MTRLTESQWKLLAAKIAGLYPRQAWDDDTVTLIGNEISGVEAEVLVEAVDAWVRREKWPPTAAELIAESKVVERRWRWAQESAAIILAERNGPDADGIYAMPVPTDIPIADARRIVAEDSTAKRLGSGEPAVPMPDEVRQGMRRLADSFEADRG